MSASPPEWIARPRAVRLLAAALVVVLLLGLSAACDDAQSPDSPGAAPTTTSPADGTSTTAPGASTSVPSTTSPAPPTTAPQGPSEPGPDNPLTLTDTGFTRVRIAIENQAEWVELTFAGVHFSLTRIVSTDGDLNVVSLGGNEIGVAGTGSALIDLVLDLRAGGTPVLNMCKNYKGPATVEVTRITTGSALLGRIDNRGTTAGAPPGGCENLASLAIDRTDLIGPERWPARRDARPLVLAGYYPWYDPDTLAGIKGDQPTGPVDTSDPDQVEQSIDLARSSGIDGFVVEWQGEPRYDRRIDLVLDAADRRSDFASALMIDFAILELHPEGLSTTAFDRALDAVAENAGRRSQLEVGGRPVVFLYGAYLVNPEVWNAALSRLEARTGLRPFVIGDDDDVTPLGLYDYGTNEFSDWDQLNQWIGDRLHKRRLQPGLMGTSAPLWVAPVSPGYDDRALGRSNPRYVPRNGGSRFEQSWNAALLSLPDWILVTSWNEYYEQTHVMPGSTTGDLALRQLDERSARFHTTG